LKSVLEMACFSSQTYQTTAGHVNVIGNARVT